MELVVVTKARFLSKDLAGFLTTPKQQVTLEMRNEVLSSVAAEKNITNGYKASDPEDIEFHLENPQSEIHAVCGPVIDTSSFHDSVAETRNKKISKKPILLDDEGTRRIRHPHLQFLRGPAIPLRRCEGVHLEQQVKMFLIMFFRSLFQKNNCVCFLIHSVIKMFHFLTIFFQIRSDMIEAQKF